MSWILLTLPATFLAADPGALTISDVPWDRGDSLKINWEPPPGTNSVRLARLGDPPTPIPVAEDQNEAIDVKLNKELAYTYRIEFLDAAGNTIGEAQSEPTSPVMNWFDAGNRVTGSLLFCFFAIVLGSIVVARRGAKFHIREIPGLKVIEEAVGRSVEMGRPCLFIAGVQDINNIQVVAGLTVLSRVARIAAEYSAQLIVPTSRSLVMTTAQDTVQSSYLAAGRPDEYHSDQIYYVSDEQFGFVAAVAGRMLRDKPAACFYFGPFYAESLFLAETGNLIGSIQIAGTAEQSQLPFFVAACDYTLLGEEFFAASAYLSKEPAQLGSLRGQDLAKVVIGLAIVIGSLWATISPFLARGV